MTTTDNLNVTDPMREKLAAVGDYPLLDSEFLNILGRPERAERVQGTKGVYLSSPVDGWILHGPFTGSE